MKSIPWLLVVLLLAGCGNSDDDSNGLFSFSSTSREAFLPLDEYQSDDFNLTEDALYWETRIGPALSAGVPQVFRHQLLFFYAQEALVATFENRLDELVQVEPLTGFADKCFPSRCLAYIAGLNPQSDFTILTDQELASFFGEIDTEAELAYWLWSADYIPLDYMVEDSGFEVTVETSVVCPQRSRLRLFVDANGVITPVETLSSESVETCENGIDRQNEVLFAGQSGGLRSDPLLPGEGLTIQSGDLSVRDDGVFIQFGNPTPQTGDVVFQGGTVPLPSQDLQPGESSSTVLDDRINNPLEPTGAQDNDPLVPGSDVQALPML